MTTEKRSQILAQLDAERDRQDAKWGEQNHPDGTGAGTRPLTAIVKLDSIPGHATADRLAGLFTQETDSYAQRGTVTWADILLEEVFEALAEDDPAKLRAELIQVAAVAAQWAEAIDRRTASPKGA